MHDPFRQQIWLLLPWQPYFFQAEYALEDCVWQSCLQFLWLSVYKICVQDKANHCRIKGMHTLHTAYYYTFNLILLSMNIILLCIVLRTAFTNSNIGIVTAIITFESLLGVFLHRVMMTTWTCNPRSLIWQYKHSL